MAIIIYGDQNSGEYSSVAVLSRKDSGVFQLHPKHVGDVELTEIVGVIHIDEMDDAEQLDGVDFTPFDTNEIKTGGGLAIDVAAQEVTVMSPEDFAAIKEF